MTKERIKELSDRIYKTISDNGFHTDDADYKYPEFKYIMLVITEVAEAVEADRKNLHADREAFEKRSNVHPDFRERFKAYVKNTVEDEFSDIAIRLLDMMGIFKVEITEEMEKLADNIRTNVWNTADGGEFVDRAYVLTKILTYGKYGVPEMTYYGLVYLEKWAESLDIDLEWHIDVKDKYNATRGYRHGKNY